MNRNRQSIAGTATSTFGRPWLARAGNPLQQLQPAPSQASAPAPSSLPPARQPPTQRPPGQAPVPRFHPPAGLPGPQASFLQYAPSLPPPTANFHPIQLTPSQPHVFPMPWSQVEAVPDDSSQGGYGGSAPDTLPPTQPSQTAARLLEELNRMAAVNDPALHALSAKLEELAKSHKDLCTAVGELRKQAAGQEQLLTGAEERLTALLQVVAAKADALPGGPSRPVTGEMATQTTPVQKEQRDAQKGSVYADSGSCHRGAPPPPSRTKRVHDGHSEDRAAKRAQPSSAAASLFGSLRGNPNASAIGAGRGGAYRGGQPAAARQDADQYTAPSKALARRMDRHRRMLLHQSQSGVTSHEL